MTMPGRLLDFFSLEATEYLARLEAMANKQGMQSPEATQFVAAARGLHEKLSGLRELGALDEALVALANQLAS